MNYGCVGLELLCALEAFFGLLYLAFCGSIMFAKIVLLHSKVWLTYYSFICFFGKRIVSSFFSYILINSTSIVVMMIVFQARVTFSSVICLEYKKESSEEDSKDDNGTWWKRVCSPRIVLVKSLPHPTWYTLFPFKKMFRVSILAVELHRTKVTTSRIHFWSSVLSMMWVHLVYYDDAVLLFDLSIHHLLFPCFFFIMDGQKIGCKQS